MGRIKGRPNKTTADLKAMILTALDKAGGDKYLLEQSKANPVAFMALLGKILPMQVNGSASVLLIEQLCVAANAECQKERAALVTIEGEAADVSDEETAIADKQRVH